MELRLDGKTALVTGGSRGIGLAIARRLAEAGAQVMLASRKAEDLAAAAERLRSELPGAEVDWYAAHAGEEEQARACASATADRFGGLDVLVNNAATNPYYGPLLELDRARAMKTVEVNQWGIVAWTRAARDAGMTGPGAAVVNLASVGGLGPEPGIGWYNATKAAVVHLTRQLAFELAPDVRVNALAPGLVKTDLARALWEGSEDRISDHIPLRRLGLPDDVATAALFLASDAASWVTGHVLVVDGGSTSQATGAVG